MIIMVGIDDKLAIPLNLDSNSQYYYYWWSCMTPCWASFLHICPSGTLACCSRVFHCQDAAPVACNWLVVVHGSVVFGSDYRISNQLILQDFPTTLMAKVLLGITFIAEPLWRVSCLFSFMFKLDLRHG